MNIDSFKSILKFCETNKVELLAVSKTKPADDIQNLYDAGQRNFGENRVQELLSKKDLLPKDIQWHLIGHLQTNKVKFIAPFIFMIQSVDSVKLLSEINKQAALCNRKINCLLQVYVATEETKFGFDKTEVKSLLNDAAFQAMKNICIKGLMGMASNTTDENQIHAEFNELKILFNDLALLKNENCDFKILSMGMSSDYKIAVEEGSTMIRIGSSLFGNRV